MIKNILIVLVFASSMVSSMAWALNLQEARDKGFVGEQQDGYVGIIKKSTEVSVLVKSVNDRRKAVYQDIVKRTGTNILVVGKQSAQKIIKKLNANHYVKNLAGKWQKK